MPAELNTFQPFFVNWAILYIILSHLLPTVYENILSFRGISMVSIWVSYVFRKRTKCNHLAVLNGSFKYYFAVVQLLSKSCLTLWLHGLQHTRLLCPPLSPRVCSDSCPLTWWCHLTISSSVALFSSCPQSCIRVFSRESALCIRWPKYWSFGFKYQSFQWMFRADFLWDWLVWSPHSPRDSQEFSPAPQSKSINFFGAHPLWPNSHIPTWLLKKPYLWLYGPLWAKWCLCFFNMLSRFVMAFLPSSKHLWISWLQSLSTEILEPAPLKSVTVFTFSLSICHEVMGLAAMILTFWVLSFKPAFSLSTFTFIKRLFYHEEI